MSQNAAVFLLIVLALLAANVPFLIERPLLVLPWSRQGVRPRAPWARWIAAVLLLAGLAAVAWLAQAWIGSALAGGGRQTLLLLLRVLLVVLAAVLLLAAPGWYLGQPGRADGVDAVLAASAPKPFFHRLLEWLALYALVGALGFAFEANQGSVFAQRWEFYAVTFSLFLVMAYPGFVARYLFKRRKG